MSKTDTPQIHYYVRSGFYALTVVLGIALALNEFDIGNESGFWLSALIIALIFGIELLSSVTRVRLTQKQLRLPYSRGGMTWNSQLVHHLLLPLNMYIAIMLFGIFNSQAHIRFAVLGFSLVSMTILFMNIAAFYADKEKLAQHTHYVYDLTKMLIFFGYTNAVFTLNQGLSSAVVIGLIAFGLMALNIYRKEQFNLEGVLWISIMSAGIGVVCSLFLLANRFNPLQLSLISFVGYYLSNGVLHHKMNGDLNLKIIAEYLVVLMLAATLLFGLV